MYCSLEDTGCHYPGLIRNPVSIFNKLGPHTHSEEKQITLTLPDSRREAKPVGFVLVSEQVTAE